MYAGKFVFSQVMDHLPFHFFRKCVRRYGGNRYVKSFPCLSQFLCMACAQLTHRESLRDIEICLRAHAGKLYHMGIRGRVSRNTLANANRRRDWRIYAEFAQELIRIARPLYAGEHPAETWIRLTLESEGRMLFHHRGFNGNLDALSELITTEWAMPGAGDAGAHISKMIDSGWATFVLSHWHRDAGLYSLEEAVRRIAGVPAEVLGLSDRGTLEVGKRADINIIDINKVDRSSSTTILHCYEVTASCPT